MRVIDDELQRELAAKAADAPRRRTHLNFHSEPDEPVQRLLIAMEPGSYVRPHRHLEQAKWELFLLLKGRALAVFFDDDGCVTRRLELDGDHVHGFEIEPGVWHTIVALESGTLFAEIKPGPYTPTTDKDFAAWAPAEGNAACSDFSAWFSTASVGDAPPVLE